VRKAALERISARAAVVLRETSGSRCPEAMSGRVVLALCKGAAGLTNNCRLNKRPVRSVYLLSLVHALGVPSSAAPANRRPNPTESRFNNRLNESFATHSGEEQTLQIVAVSSAFDSSRHFAIINYRIAIGFIVAQGWACLNVPEKLLYDQGLSFSSEIPATMIKEPLLKCRIRKLSMSDTYVHY